MPELCAREDETSDNIIEETFSNCYLERENNYKLDHPSYLHFVILDEHLKPDGQSKMQIFITHQIVDRMVS